MADFDYAAAQTARTAPVTQTSPLDPRTQTQGTAGSLGGDALGTAPVMSNETGGGIQAPAPMDQTPTLGAPITGTTGPAPDPGLAPYTPTKSIENPYVPSSVAPPVPSPVAGTPAPTADPIQAAGAAQGVLASPETSPATPGWTYGANPTGTQLQGGVAPGQTDAGKVGWDGLPVTSINQGSPYYDKAIDASYQQATSRLDPQMQAQQQRLETQLQNMGLTRGSAAWNSEMDRQMRAANDAYTSARNSAIMLGGQEAARMQGMDIASGNFANSAANTNFQNTLQSQEAQNKAYQQAFEQAMASGQFANAAQAQEFAQNQVQAQLRNQAMASQGSLAEQAAARQQQGTQFQQSLGETQAARQQSGSQFQQTLGETQAARQQAGAQWASEFGLKTEAQQAQMDQFAQTLGMTGQQLQAQIAQWAAQNGLSKEQMANQLLMSREQNQTQLGVAGTQAGATLGAAQAQAGATTAVGQMNAALQQRAIEDRERQQDFDMYWQAQMNPVTLQNLQMQGMVPTDPNFATVQTPAIPGTSQATTPAGAAAATAGGVGQIAGALGGYFLGP